MYLPLPWRQSLRNFAALAMLVAMVNVSHAAIFTDDFSTGLSSKYQVTLGAGISYDASGGNVVVTSTVFPTDYGRFNLCFGAVGNFSSSIIVNQTNIFG